MQFQVPQFIETEDKIIGPFTLKQFLYIGAAAILSFLSFFVMEPWLWLFVTMLLAAAAVALAFVKINGRSMITVIFSAFNYTWNPRVYVFKKAGSAPVVPQTPVLKGVYKKETGSLRDVGEQLSTSKNVIPKREKALPPLWNPFKEQANKTQYEAVRKIAGDKEIARKVDYR